ALRRYREFEKELGPRLTRFAVEEVVRRCRAAGDLHWPAGVDADREVEALARRLEADHGTALAKGPALEDVTRISRETARRLKEGPPHGTQSGRFAEQAVKAQLGKKDREDAAFQPFAPLKDELKEPFAARVFLRQRQAGPKGDLVDDEFGRVLQVPGWVNIFTQPIINRIEMLSTGVRTDIGVKVFGPDLDTIDRVCKDIESALKPVNGVRDVVAAPVTGKGYLEIDINLEKAARVGVSALD